jgi:hypothetical protein
MASLNKRNQTLYARGTLYETAQVRAWKVALETALTASTLNESTGVVTRGTIADVAEELGTTAMLFQPSADGTTFIIVGDSHALDVDTIARRLGHIIEATGLLEGAGVWKDAAGGNAVVTVTAITSFIGITE